MALKFSIIVRNFMSPGPAESQEQHILNLDQPYLRHFQFMWPTVMIQPLQDGWMLSLSDLSPLPVPLQVCLGALGWGLPQGVLCYREIYLTW